MGKRTTTTVTFNVRVILPPSVNINQMRDMIKTSLLNYAGKDGTTPRFDLDDSDVGVSLQKKVTTYG